MPRGARIWNQSDSADLFAGEPAIEPAPAPAAPATAAPAGPRYSERECRRLERVYDLFKDWLFAADLAALKKAELAALARRFPPMREDDVAEWIARQIAAYDRKDETWRKWQRIR